MPRRIPDYPDAFTGWNYIASFGSYLSIISLFVFGLVLYFAFTQKLNTSSTKFSKLLTLEYTFSKKVFNLEPFYVYGAVENVILGVIKNLVPLNKIVSQFSGFIYHKPALTEDALVKSLNLKPSKLFIIQ